jgi:hypothetical protein
VIFPPLGDDNILLKLANNILNPQKTIACERY